MSKLKKFLKNFKFLLPFQVELKIHRWIIFFNGDPVGVYWGPDLLNLDIEYWMESFPGDCEPIMLVEMFDIF